MRNNQKGASLYFSLDILAILIAIVVGISTIIVVQLTNLKQAGDSVVAFYAADAGIERTLWEDKANEAQIDDYFDDQFLDDAEIVASYHSIIISSSTEGCTAKYYCIRSIGKYESSDTRRGIQINR